MKPLVSIIIVNYNGEKYIEECLKSISEQIYNNIEIVLVDNNSQDSSLKIIEKFQNIKLIKLNHNSYFAEGNNIGVKNSKGEILLLLNNDAYLEKNTIEKIVDFFEKHKNAGIVQNKIVYAENPELIDSAGSFMSISGFLIHQNHHGKASKSNKNHKIFAGKGASLAIRKEILEKTWLFDSEYKLYFEDTDLCWRSILLGFDNYLLADALTYHRVTSSTDKSTLHVIDFHSFKNRLRSILTNLSPLFLIFVLPIHLLICLAISIIFVFKNYKSSLAILKAASWNILHLNSTLKTRKKIQSIRQVSDFYIFRKYSRIPNPFYIVNFIRFYLIRKS
ncbi:MAG TPA: glycosyltransferase family 2 protein [Candidatus Dojkabacteria bacterium]|jgi:hypothetical protein